jgi:hypothetical protein
MRQNPSPRRQIGNRSRQGQVVSKIHDPGIAHAVYQTHTQRRGSSKAARVSLAWATTQNLDVALESLGKRESGTARLEEAVAAYRHAQGDQCRVALNRESGKFLGVECRPLWCL